MKSSFMFYLLGIAYVIILFYNLGQTFKWLTSTEINTPYILERTMIYLFSPVAMHGLLPIIFIIKCSVNERVFLYHG